MLNLVVHIVTTGLCGLTSSRGWLKNSRSVLKLKHVWCLLLTLPTRYLSVKLSVADASYPIPFCHHTFLILLHVSRLHTVSPVETASYHNRLITHPADALSLGIHKHWHRLGPASSTDNVCALQDLIIQPTFPLRLEVSFLAFYKVQRKKDTIAADGTQSVCTDWPGNICDS